MGLQKFLLRSPAKEKALFYGATAIMPAASGFGGRCPCHIATLLLLDSVAMVAPVGITFMGLALGIDQMFIAGLVFTGLVLFAGFLHWRMSRW